MFRTDSRKYKVILGKIRNLARLSSHLSLNNSAMLVCFRHFGMNHRPIPLFFAVLQNSSAVVIESTTSSVKVVLPPLLWRTPKNIDAMRNVIDMQRDSGILGHELNTFDLARQVWSYEKVYWCSWRIFWEKTKSILPEIFLLVFPYCVPLTLYKKNFLSIYKIWQPYLSTHTSTHTSQERLFISLIEIIF